MVNETESAIQPLLNVKTALELDIAQVLEKVAIKRKRLEAVKVAIDVLRTSDDAMAEVIVAKPPVLKSRPDVDLDKWIYEFAKELKQFTIKEVTTFLNEGAISYSGYAVRQILNDSSVYERVGRDNYISYRLRKETALSAGA